MKLWQEDEARAVLGIAPDSDEKTLRSAYLREVRKHSPESDPEGFERVRDAYLTLTNAKGRMRRWFDAEELKRPLSELSTGIGDNKARVFLGVEPWRELLIHFRRKSGEKRV